MKEVIFNSQADFDQWHEKVKQAEGYPRVGRNAATGELAPHKQQTTDYVRSKQHPTDVRVMCVVDENNLRANLKAGITFEPKGKAQALGWLLLD